MEDSGRILFLFPFLFFCYRINSKINLFIDILLGYPDLNYMKKSIILCAFIFALTSHLDSRPSLFGFSPFTEEKPASTDEKETGNTPSDPSKPTPLSRKTPGKVLIQYQESHATLCDLSNCNVVPEVAVLYTEARIPTK